jgi:hypothetical protein
MAAVLALIVFAGFSSSYYLRFLDTGPQVTFSGQPFTKLVHLHGALFTAWVLLFVVQTALVAGRRVNVHRRLGAAGAALAAAMIVVGLVTARAAAQRGAAPPGMNPLSFLAIPFFDILLFATFVTTALILRRNRDAHKRLMLLAYTAVIVAAMARLPGVSARGPFAFFGMAFLVVLTGVAYDLFSRRQVHKVYLWGGTLFALSVPLRLAISGTDAWLAFAGWFTR